MSELLMSPIEPLGRKIILPHESPCPQDGGFLINGTENMDPDVRYSPVDELTGVPLLLHPEGIANRDRHKYKDDEHHPWHPKRHVLLSAETYGGFALRSSRVQLGSYDAHHLNYHGDAKGYFGPKLPEDADSRFKLVVLTAAGYIPDQAIAFNKHHNPYMKKLAVELKMWLWYSNTIRVDKPKEVQKFLKAFSYGQTLSDVKDSTIDEFLHTSNPDKRWELGNDLLGRAVYQATYPIKDIYRIGYQSERIPHVRAKNVSRFVLSALGTRRYRQTIIDELGNHIKQRVA